MLILTPSERSCQVDVPKPQDHPKWSPALRLVSLATCTPSPPYFSMWGHDPTEPFAPSKVACGSRLNMLKLWTCSLVVALMALEIWVSR
jgi:hypothetical protein